MKNPKLSLYLKIGLSMAFLVLLAIQVFAPDLTSPLVEFIGLGAGGSVLANTAIIGTPTYEKTETSSPEHQERHVSDVVTEMRPDEFPLDTMIRNIRKSEKAGNVKVEFETVKYRERVSKATTAFVAAGDATDENVLLEVDNINIWGLHDTAIVPGVAGADGQDLRLFVMEVVRADNEIRVTAVNSPTADTQRVPSIAQDSPLRRMGTAKQEMDSTTDIITQEPTIDYNFCQIQMAYINQSVLKGLMKTYSGYSYKDRFVQEIYNMRSSCEATGIYGARSRVLDKVTGKYHYAADGIKKRIKNTTTFRGNDTTSEVISSKDVNALLEKVFAGNAGSDERLLVSGSSIIKHLQDVKLEKNIGPTQTKTVHGVMVTELQTNFGLLNIKHSKTMDIFNDQETAMILDLKHIFKHDLETMHQTKLDPDKAGQGRVKDAVRILENSCLTTRYDDVHYIWKRDAANNN